MLGFTTYKADQQLFSNDNAAIVFASNEVGKQWYFHHNTNDKFSEDKFFVETEKYIIGLDGVILNAQNLKNEFGENDLLKIMLKLYEIENQILPQRLRGEFNGFVFDKSTENFFAFTNHTATKPTMYAMCGEDVVISSSIYHVVKVFKHHKANYHLDYKAVYALLTFGGMIGNNTLIEEVKKLQGGECITSTQGNAIKFCYHDYNDVDLEEHSEKESIEMLDRVFIRNLKLEYDKDKSAKYSSLATLSGGLDSRMNVMLSQTLGYDINKLFCFSQTGYWDQIIASQIADELVLRFQFVPLDGGDYIKDIDEGIKINSGLAFYLGAAHVNKALPHVYEKKNGLLHTGQIGDGILGGFNSSRVEEKATLHTKVISDRFFHKIENAYSKLPENYKNEEVYKLHNRVFNITNTGSFVTEKHSYLVSPFNHPEMINYCLSMDPRLKFDQYIYLKWMLAKHEEVTKYKWETLLIKPTSRWKLRWGRIKRKATNQYYKKINSDASKLSMTPYAYWKRTNPSIMEYLNGYFEKHIHFLDAHPELKEDVITAFGEEDIIKKALPISLLSFLKQIEEV